MTVFADRFPSQQLRTIWQPDNVTVIAVDLGLVGHRRRYRMRVLTIEVSSREGLIGKLEQMSVCAVDLRARRLSEKDMRVNPTLSLGFLAGQPDRCQRVGFLFLICRRGGGNLRNRSGWRCRGRRRLFVTARGFWDGCNLSTLGSALWKDDDRAGRRGNRSAPRRRLLDSDDDILGARDRKPSSFVRLVPVDPQTRIKRCLHPLDLL
jgi:hypothetical protein